MRYYFAGAYARRAELAGLALALEHAGIGAVVTSRWLTEDQTGEDSGFTAEGLADPSRAARAWEYGERDIVDLLHYSDAIVSFTGEGTRGGRHVEHGYAMALREAGGTDGMSLVRLIVIGPREHVFHCHPATEVYRGFAEFLAHEIKQHREGMR